jgi:tetratricopeptide (TPR) repeat protein
MASLDRRVSLESCIYYSFQHLSDEHRALLPALTLFEGAVSIPMLKVLGATEDVPARFSGVAEEQWWEALERCVAVGLLMPRGAGLYGIHPALPPYLAALWREEAGEGYDAEFHAARRVAVLGCAAVSYWLYRDLDGDGAGDALAVLRELRRTLGRAAHWAMETGAFEHARLILKPLFQLFEIVGATAELSRWVDRCLTAVEGPLGEVPDLQSQAGQLWVSAYSAAASVALKAGDLGRAEAAYRRLRSLFETSGDVFASPVADVNLRLGSVAVSGGDFDTADRCFREALEIYERLEDESGRASAYYQLGLLAQERRQFEDADRWYRQSVTFWEEVGNVQETAKVYHQLGIVTEHRSELVGCPEAEEWYRKALDIKEELQDRPGISATYHQLGVLMQHRGDIAAAESWYHRSLVIEEEMGHRYGMALNYHGLGVIAYGRRDLATAEAWLRKAIAIREEMGDVPGMASGYGTLGMLREDAGDADGAMEWLVRCVSLFPEFPHPATYPGPGELLRLTRVLGFPALEAAWLRVTGEPLRTQIRDEFTMLSEYLDRKEADDDVDA